MSAKRNGDAGAGKRLGRRAAHAIASILGQNDGSQSISLQIMDPLELEHARPGAKTWRECTYGTGIKQGVKAHDTLKRDN